MRAGIAEMNASQLACPRCDIEHLYRIDTFANIMICSRRLFNDDFMTSNYVHFSTSEPTGAADPMLSRPRLGKHSMASCT